MVRVGRRALLAAAFSAPMAARAAGGVPLAAQPIPRLELAWWRSRHAAKLAEIRSRPVDLVMLGDSITQQYEHGGDDPLTDFRPVWTRFYGDRNAVNLGFVGDATSHLLWRIRNGEVEGIAPRAAVVLIGANNLGRLHWSAEDTVTGIVTIIDDLQARLPATRMLLVGVLPSGRGAWVARSTAAINAALARRYGSATDGRVTFRDVSASFMRDGMLDADLFTDPRLTPRAPPLHPTPQGQALMAAAIEPTLAALMGDRDHTA